MTLLSKELHEVADEIGKMIGPDNHFKRWAALAQNLESENEELKSKLDEYIENERARMEEAEDA